MPKIKNESILIFKKIEQAGVSHGDKHNEETHYQANTTPNSVNYGLGSPVCDPFTWSCLLCSTKNSSRGVYLPLKFRLYPRWNAEQENVTSYHCNVYILACWYRNRLDEPS